MLSPVHPPPTTHRLPPPSQRGDQNLTFAMDQSQYRPLSPDLSSLLDTPSKHDQPYQPHSQLHSRSRSNSSLQPDSQGHVPGQSYAPRSPSIPPFDTPNTSSFHQPQGLGLGGSINSTNTQYMPPIPDLPPQHSFAQIPSPYHQPQQPQYSPTKSQYSPVKAEYPAQSYGPVQPPYNNYQAYTDGANDLRSNTMSRAPRIKGEDHLSFQTGAAASAPAYKNPNPTNIEIKTKFPVARIKRIMQADEEVGKVAQVTPVAVNKALELFMIALVTGAAAKAKEKGGKRVTAQHLKAVVEGDEQFDFLGDIVGRVADVQEGAGGESRKRKEKNVSSDSDGEEKKPKKGKGRRKKSDE